MSEQPNRVQGGVPAGGQFATGPRAESTVSLEDPDTTSPRALADIGLPFNGDIVITDDQTGDAAFPEIAVSRRSWGFAVTGRVPVDQEVIDRAGGPQTVNQILARRFGGVLATGGDGDPVVEFTTVLEGGAREDEIVSSLHEHTQADSFIAAVAGGELA